MDLALVFARGSFLCNPLRFLYGRALLLLRGRHSFLILWDKPNPLPCCTLLLRSPFRPPQGLFARLYSASPAHPIPGKMDHGKLLCATAASKPKPTWFTHRILCPSRDFWRSPGQKLPPRDLPNPWKKAIQCVLAAQGALPITATTKERHIGLKLTLILSTDVVEICMTSILYLVSHGMLAHEEENFLSLPKVRHLRSPYPSLSLIFRRIPSCRTSAPSPLTVWNEFRVSSVGPRGDQIVSCTQ